LSWLVASVAELVASVAELVAFVVVLVASVVELVAFVVELAASVVELIASNYVSLKLNASDSVSLKLEASKIVGVARRTESGEGACCLGAIADLFQLRLVALPFCDFNAAVFGGCNCPGHWTIHKIMFLPQIVLF